jgi:transcriptional regulator with XRE-family HTH domain
MGMPASHESTLGVYLKRLRAKLDPALCGLPEERRRTPGLRRDEVARRAHISLAWYTGLEQGRGGAPSAGVLDRIADALMLTDIEREHLFLIGLRRPLGARYQKNEDASPLLQCILDRLEPCPAFIRTPTWDVVAWNRPAALVLSDYGSRPRNERNILRSLFLDPRVSAAQHDWRSVARFAVGAFRADSTRAGAAAEIEPLVDELCRLSPEFRAIWSENDVRSFGEGMKRLRHPTLGPLALSYSAFAVEGRRDLKMVVFNPATPADSDKVSTLLGEAVAIERRAPLPPSQNVTSKF